MKKHLLFIAVMLVMVGANAQITWTAKAYAEEQALEDAAIAIAPGGEITLENITFTASGATDWLIHIDPENGEFDYNGVTYGKTMVQGQSNGKAGYIDGGTTSSVAVFQPTVDGTLDLAFKYGYNKPFYVAEFTEDALDEVDLASADAVLPYAYNDGQYWGGFWSSTDGTYYVPEDGVAVDGGLVYYSGCTLDVVAGNYYYAWASGSKIMLSGFTFTAAEGTDPGVGVKDFINSSELIKTEYYNTLGVKLTEPANGVTIIKKTYANGAIVTSKSVFRK